MVGASVPGWLAPGQTFRVSAATLDAAVSAGAITTGTLTTTITVAGAILATATSTGALTRGVTIAGTVLVTAASTGTLTIPPPIWLTSADLATATLTGTLTVTPPGRGPMLRSRAAPYHGPLVTHASTGAARQGQSTTPGIRYGTTPLWPSRTVELVTDDA